MLKKKLKITRTYDKESYSYDGKVCIIDLETGEDLVKKYTITAVNINIEAGQIPTMTLTILNPEIDMDFLSDEIVYNESKLPQG